MTLDIAILVSGGLLALVAGGLLAFLSPARYASLVAAAALGSLGLLQFGWARALYEIGASGGGIWFELSMAFALPVSLCWVLLSLTLARGPDPALPAVWRLYIVVQALFSLAALAFVTIAPSGQALAFAPGRRSFPLRPAGDAMLAGVLVNLVLLTANFESTYLSLSRAARGAFRPGLLGILLAAGYFAYVCAASLWAGRVDVRDLSLGAVAVAGLALLLPLSLLRGRVADARRKRSERPVTSTASLMIAVGFLSTTSALIAITRLTGWSLARSLWMLLTVGVALGIAALAVSNRLQRRFQRLIDPYLDRHRADRRALAARAESSIHRARTIAELCALIPHCTRELVGMDPVTLFVADEREARFVVAASTMVPPPLVSIPSGDPLAVELRRTDHAMPLRGRSDDLEFIPIYVENATQIAACSAESAAPILRDEELFAILLCGPAVRDVGRRGSHLAHLDLVCRRFSSRLEAVGGQGSRRGLSDRGPTLHI